MIVLNINMRIVTGMIIKLKEKYRCVRNELLARKCRITFLQAHL